VAASKEAEQGRWLCTNAKMDACNWLVDDGSMTLTAQFAANGIKNDPTSTARLYAGSKKTWRIYWVKTLSHHMR
jgi:hypothetical protein